MKKSAGVIIILNNNKILLSHATNARWEKTFSFPKGGIEKGRMFLDKLKKPPLYGLENDNPPI